MANQNRDEGPNNPEEVNVIGAGLGGYTSEGITALAEDIKELIAARGEAAEQSVNAGGSDQPVTVNVYNVLGNTSRARSSSRRRNSNGNGSNGNRTTVSQLHQEFNQYRTHLDQRLDDIVQRFSNPQQPAQAQGGLGPEDYRWLQENFRELNRRDGVLEGRINELGERVYPQQPVQDGQGDNQRRDEAHPRDGDNQPRDRAQDGDYQRGRDGRGDEAHPEEDHGDNQPPREEDNQREERDPEYDRQDEDNDGNQEDNQPTGDEPREDQTEQSQEDIGEPPQEEQPPAPEEDEPVEEPEEQERTGVIKAYFDLKKQVENEITGIELDVMQCYVLAARAALKVEGDIRQIDLDKLEEKVTEGKYLLSLYKNLSERARKSLFVSEYKDDTHRDDVMYGHFGFGLPSLEATVAEKKSGIKYDDIWKLCANRVKAKRALPGTKIREEDTEKVLPYVGLKSGRDTLEKGLLLGLLGAYESQGKITSEQIKSLNESKGTKLSYAA